MPACETADWSAYLRQTLERYDEPLLRQVAGQLFRPRSQWPVEELIDRSVATVGNAAVVDRRLESLAPAARRLLGLIGHSRQPRWRVGPLLEMLAALGHAEGPKPIFDLFAVGLLYPDLPVSITNGRLKDFEQWLGQASLTGLLVFAHPDVTGRLLTQDLGLPECPGAVTLKNAPVHEADGLEWLLRLAVLWQQAGTPFRRTQQGDFFKRDLERLRSDPLLNGRPLDSPGKVQDAGLLAVALAVGADVLQPSENELRAGRLPLAWEQGLYPALADLWESLPRLDAWEPVSGWRVAAPGEAAANPFVSTYLLLCLLLARLPRDGWADPDALGQWIQEHHPWYAGRTGETGAADFLRGLAFQLRLVQATPHGNDGWLVRLSPLGRWFLGLGDKLASPPAFPQTLLVQPNLEILAYRQGLSPELISQLSLFAAWKSVGPACTLQLQAETVYRALEAGQTFDTIRLTLERRGMKAVPSAVLDSLRTWANKRERITIYPSATLFEFATAAELSGALARGLPGTRLTDRLALVPGEGAVDFRHYRLMGTRDYSLPPERCVEVEADGVTLIIDLTRSDLLVESEMQRFAEAVERSPRPAGDRAITRHYRLTPASLAAARNSGWHLRALEDWFLQRTGQPVSAAARLLLVGSQLPPVELQEQLVLTVANAETADGLLQMPETRALIEKRLGPTALVIAPENAETLRQRLKVLGLLAGE